MVRCPRKVVLMSGWVSVERFVLKGLRVWAVLLAVGLVAGMGFAAWPAVASAADTWNFAADMQANALSFIPLVTRFQTLMDMPVCGADGRAEHDPVPGELLRLGVARQRSMRYPGHCRVAQRGWNTTRRGLSQYDKQRDSRQRMWSQSDYSHEAFMHPGPANDSLVAWHSPITGTVSVSGGVSDADHGCGNGIAWYIDQGSNDLASGVNRQRRCAGLPGRPYRDSH